MSSGFSTQCNFHVAIDRKATRKSLLLRRRWRTCGEEASCVQERPRAWICFSKQTAQLILLPHTDPSSAPTVLKHQSFQRATATSALATSPTLMKLLSSRMTVYLQEKETFQNAAGRKHRDIQEVERLDLSAGVHA